MATKRNGCDCYENAGMDEPIFVLRARDVLAASVVENWVTAAEGAGVPVEKRLEAARCAKAMRDWGAKNGVHVPD